jgi:hypothetical protein
MERAWTNFDNGLQPARGTIGKKDPQRGDAKP